jgi:hypothetical protein
MIADILAILLVILLAKTTGSLVDRFNYASFDCAARILATSPDTKTAWAILQPYQRDSYMSFLCKNPSKFIIIELCSDIRIDTVVLANTEHFSSTFEKFRIYGGKKFSGTATPINTDANVEEWFELGTFSAKNTRDEQDFLLTNQENNGFIRFLKIEFLTHYGREYYCPVSFIKVFGKTMMEDFVDNQSTSIVNQQKGETFRTKYELVPFIGKSGKGGDECSAIEENIYKSMHDRLKRLEKKLQQEENEHSQEAEGEQKRLSVLEEKIRYLKQAVVILLVISVLNLVYTLFFTRSKKGVYNGYNTGSGKNFALTPGPTLFDDSFHTGNHSSTSQTTMASPKSSKLK